MRGLSSLRRANDAILNALVISFRQRSDRSLCKPQQYINVVCKQSKKLSTFTLVNFSFGPGPKKSRRKVEQVEKEGRQTRELPHNGTENM